MEWRRPEEGKVGRCTLYLERGCNFLLATIVITPQSFVRKEKKVLVAISPPFQAVRVRVRRRRRVIYCSPVLMSKTTLRLLGGELERHPAQLLLRHDDDGGPF